MFSSRRWDDRGSAAIHAAPPSSAAAVALAREPFDSMFEGHVVATSAAAFPTVESSESHEDAALGAGGDSVDC